MATRQSRCAGDRPGWPAQRRHDVLAPTTHSHYHTGDRIHERVVHRLRRAQPCLRLRPRLPSRIVSLAFYRLFLSPLASIPGPWYAVSDFWITTHVVRMQQCRTVQHLFDTYGPIVRIGPNKVAFRDFGTMRSVYMVHKFDKSAYYKSLLTCVAASVTCLTKC